MLRVRFALSADDGWLLAPGSVPGQALHNDVAPRVSARTLALNSRFRCRLKQGPLGLTAGSEQAGEGGAAMDPRDGLTDVPTRVSQRRSR